MKVTLKYTSQAKLFAGKASEDIEIFDGASVAQLIQNIAARDNPSLRNLLISEDGTARQSYLVFVGDRCLRGNADDLLSHNDEITIMSMISGG